MGWRSLKCPLLWVLRRYVEYANKIWTQVGKNSQVLTTAQPMAECKKAQLSHASNLEDEDMKY